MAGGPFEVLWQGSRAAEDEPTPRFESPSSKCVVVVRRGVPTLLLRSKVVTNFSNQSDVIKIESKKQLVE